MKDMVGSPGTRCSLVLRVSQLLCAGASFAAMATADTTATNNFNAFRYLIPVIMLQVCWSFGLACVDIYCLKTGADFHTFGFVVPTTIADWVMSVLMFAAASASAGLAAFFQRDIDCCAWTTLCSNYNLAIFLAFMAWSFMAASATSMFWLLVSLD